jgi:endonuclease YncB( thermonuclease family)
MRFLSSINVMRVLLLFILLVLATSARAAYADTHTVDGDTLIVNGVTYRLHGIDAPELDQHCVDEFGDVYACGQRARHVLQQFIHERPIHCDDLGADPKYPHRRIGHCTLDGVDLHAWLVREGWAVNFEPYARGRFAEDERHAREVRSGIWEGCFVTPQDFRRWNKDTASLIGPTCTPDARPAFFPDHAAMPLGCEIKGKYALRALLTGHRGIYHVPGCGSYRRTKGPDRWFCSEEDALAAGFRRSLTCSLQ